MGPLRWQTPRARGAVVDPGSLPVDVARSRRGTGRCGARVGSGIVAVADFESGHEPGEAERATLRVSARRPDGHLGPLEAAFSAETLDGDRRLGRLLLLALAAHQLALVLYQTVFVPPPPELERLRVLVLTMVGGAGIAAVLAGRAHTRRALDTIVGGALLGTAGLVAGALRFTPGELAHPAIVLLTLCATLLAPVSFGARLAPALVLLGATVAEGLPRSLGAPEALTGFLPRFLVLTLAVGLGLLLSVRMRRDRRRIFLEERRLLELEAREAELGRLLPVCAYCGQVRRDDGFWEQARDWLDRNRIVRGLRALCSRCGAGERGVRPDCADASAQPAACNVRADSVAVAEEATDAGVALREAELPRSRRGAVVLLGGMAAYVAANVLRAAGTESGALWSDPVQGARLVILVVVVGTLVRIQRSRSLERIERALFAFACFGAAAVGVFLFVGARGAVSSEPLLVALLCWLVLPLPLRRRAVPALAVTLPAMAVALGGEGTGDAPALQAASTATAPGGYVVLALLFGNVVGAWGSALVDGEQRRRLEVVREQRASLERARQLDLLVPMCDGCGRVRDDHGYWDDVFAFLGRHSAYRPSHGICPSCVRTHFPDLAGTVLDAGAPR